MTLAESGWVPDGQAEAAEPLYKSLPEFVEGHLALLIRRRLGGGLTWCAQWWKHAEAVSRLNAVWDEWEKARAEGTMSNWWNYHCDPALDRLMSRDNGPFMACRADGEGARHTRLDALPCEPSDPRLWQGAAFSEPGHASEAVPNGEADRGSTLGETRAGEGAK